jgi:flagellar FliJ protein
MMHKSPILTLIEISEKNSDTAAKRLGKTISAREETEKQLKMLLEYRDDYQQRFEQGAARGLSTTQYINFSSFIHKLDTAVEGQREIVRNAESKIKLARNQWQESEKERLSYNTLNNRNQATQQKKEAKQDQKQTDEHAARAFFYKR